MQGKGWTPAKEVTDEDVLGTQRGDALVLSNRVIAQGATVYNFSVAQTPNYFVGRDGLWVHNARCEIIPGGLAAHEGKGHTLAKHVNVTRQDIIDRANGRPPWSASPPPYASRFKDRATAEYAIGTAMMKPEEQAKIQGWLNNPTARPTYEIQLVFSTSIGESVAQRTSFATPATKVKVVLIKTNSNSLGYFLLTAYPGV